MQPLAALLSDEVFILESLLAHSEVPLCTLHNDVVHVH